MRQVRLLAVIVALLVALAPKPALAADLRGDRTITIGPNEIVNDDVYASGNEVNIQGTVNGDVVAFGGTIDVPGTVVGDVIAAGGTIDVGGTVRGSVRAAGGNITIHGRVIRDVVLAGGTLTISPLASVGRDALLAGSTATVAGTIARNLRASVSDLTIAGHVGGNVDANVQTLRLADGAVVYGNLVYTSSRDAAVAPGAIVRGRTEHHRPPAEVPASPLDRIGELILGWLRALVGFFMLGLLLVLPFPHFTVQTLDTIRRSPWASLALGFGLLAGVPLLAMIVFVLGLLIGGWWLSVFLLAIYAIALAVGYVVVGAFLGCWILDRIGRTGASLAGALLVGLIGLLLVGLVPIAGGIVGFLAVLVGLGSLALTSYRLWQERRVGVSS